MRKIENILKTLLIAGFFVLAGNLTLTAQVQDITRDGKSVRIPFETFQDFIIVRVQLFGNIELNLIFDTGAQHTVLFHRIYTDIMGVEYDRRIPIYGADLTRELHALIAHNIPIKAKPALNKNMSILVLEEDQSVIDQMIGKPVHGLLGSSFFNDYVLEINYRGRYLELHRISEFETPGEDYRAFPIEVIDGKPYVSAVVHLDDKSKTELRFLLDTGAGLPLLLHSNTHDKLQVPEKAISGQLGAGLGGYLQGFLSRIPGLELWDNHFANIVVSYQDIDTLLRDFKNLNRQGIIGNQILSRFHIYIHYPEGRIYLKPNRDIDEPFRYDMSGLSIIAAGPQLDRYYISHVVEDSPAFEAGLRRGDRIVAFQRWPIDFHSLQSMSNRLKKKEGKRIRIRIERNEERETFTFRLRELF